MAIKEVSEFQGTESPRIVWISVEDAVNLLYDNNPKKHDIGGICESIKRYGWQELPKYDESLGAIKAGNGRVSAIAQMEQSGETLPRGVAIKNSTKKWVIPILCGIDAKSEVEAKGYLIDSNNLTLIGGDFTALDVARSYDDSYLSILKELAEESAFPVSVDGDDLDLLLEEIETGENEGDDKPKQSEDTLLVKVKCRSVQEKEELIDYLKENKYKVS